MSKRMFVISLLVFGILINSFNFAVRSEKPSGIFLIENAQDWVNAGFDNDSNLPVYNRIGLIEFYMPVALKKEDVHNLQNKDIEHTIYNGNQNFSDRLRSIDFEILESDTYFVVVYHMLVYASDKSFHIDFVPKIKGEELPQFAWWKSSWDNFRTITINHDYVTASLVDYPLMLTIDESIADWFNDNASDVRFVSVDNTTIFRTEKELILNTGDRTFWVKIPYIYADVDTVFLMYYNNTNAEPLFYVESIWNANFINIQHLNETSGTFYDSTSNNNDSTSEDISTYNAVGIVGGCVDLVSASTDYIEFADIGDLNIYTVEIWIQHEGISADDVIWGKNAEPAIFCNLAGSDFYFGDNTGVIIGGSYSADIWYYIVGICDGSNIYLYQDTWLIGSDGSTDNFDADYMVGNRLGDAYHFEGRLDEFRISNIARNDSYRLLTYNNIKNFVSVVIIGGEVSPPPPPPSINITTTLPYPNYAWLSVSGVRAVGIRPADIKLNDNDFVVAEFSDNAEEYIQANLMIPIDANRSSNISICIGWSSPVVNKTCDWEITYLITGRNENTDQVGTMIQTYNNSSAVPNGLVTHHVLTLTPDNFSDVDVCIHIQVMRDGNDENDNIDNIVEIHGIAIGYTANVTGFTESEADELFLSSAFSLTTESLVLLIWMFFIILGEWKTDWVYKILQLPIGLTYGVTLLDANMYLGLGVIFASIYILAIAFWQSRKEKND